MGDIESEGPNPVTCRKVIQKVGTCAMETKSPECFNYFESVKMQWDMEPGDAILWDRWTFHKTVVSVADETDHGVVATSPMRRYSVRYMPSTARALGAVHGSVEQGAIFDSPYYPQVWPTLLEPELKALQHGLEGDLSFASTIRILAFIVIRRVKKLIAAIQVRREQLAIQLEDLQLMMLELDQVEQRAAEALDKS